METFFSTLFYSSVFIPFLTIISVLLNTKKLDKPTLITILFLSGISLSTDLISWWLITLSSYHKGIQHAYTFITGSILAYYFLTQYRSQWRWVLSSYIVFAALCVMSAFLWGGISAVNTVPSTGLNVFVMIFSLAYFPKAINELKYNKITYDFHFWINFGLLLLNGTTLFISLFEVYIRESNSELTLYTWLIQLIANILFNLILTGGIWYISKRIS